MAIEPELIHSDQDLSVAFVFGKMFDGADRAVVALIEEMLLRDTDFSRRSAILRKALEETKSLWLPCFVAHTNDRDNEPTQPKNRFVMTVDDSKAACTACARRIRAAADSGELEKHPFLVPLLYRWQKWGSSGEVGTYIQRLISTYTGLIRFLMGWINVRHESSSGDRVSHPQKYINLDALREFVSVDELANRVQSLEELDGEISEDQRAVIAFFLDAKNQQDVEQGNP